jgi:phage gpG-like protein
MSQEIAFELTPKAQRLLQTLRNAPMSAPKDIAAAMDKENLATVSHIQTAYLSFSKGGPAVAIGLRVQSNRLRGAAWASPAVVSGNTISSAIGDNVKYAAIHEFGGTIHHAARSGTVRLKTDARGNLVGQRKNARLAVFAKASHKRVKEVGFRSEAYDIEMPARHMFQRGITDRSEAYSRRISAAVIAAMKGAGE